MRRSAPWDDILIPSSDFTVVRVAHPAVLPLYWGRDVAAQCLFIIELVGDFTAQFRRDKISLHGIDVDLRDSETVGQQRLVLTLARHIDSDLFLSLCESLIGSLKDVSDPGTALALSLAHLKRWKAFLSGGKVRRLSPEEIRGLIGELHVLRKIYQDTLPQVAAVDAWCGPDASHQDFIFGNRAIEVKSLSGRERSTARISSEDQLESLVDDLYLLTQHLSDMPGAAHAFSLNELVAVIEEELSDAEAIEQFADKLVSAGYAPFAEYDNPRFVVKESRSYRVTDDFPRLIRSRLPQGITKLSYDIKLETIERFYCEEADLFRRP